MPFRTLETSHAKLKWIRFSGSDVLVTIWDNTTGLGAKLRISQSFFDQLYHTCCTCLLFKKLAKIRYPPLALRMLKVRKTTVRRVPVLRQGSAHKRKPKGDPCVDKTMLAQKAGGGGGDEISP